MRFLAVCFAFTAGLATAADAQSLASPSLPASRLDSAAIRRLPVTRGAEVPSFLPGAILGLEYQPRFRGATGGFDVVIDGVPVRNFTFGSPGISLPVFSLSSVQTDSAMIAVQSRVPTRLDVQTLAGRGPWHAYVHGGTDEGLPGSIGNARIAAGGSGSLLHNLGASAHVSAQSAQRTEFNNLGGLPVYRVAGLDTTVLIPATSGSPGQTDTRAVGIFAFEETAANQIPASGWNELLANVRVDFGGGGAIRAFAAGYYSRVQEREPFGGGCGICSLYNSASQRGGAMRATMLSVGLDWFIGPNTALELRVARSKDRRQSGVLRESFISSRSDGVTLDIDEFVFLVTPDEFDVTDELISNVRNNTGERSPFPVDGTVALSSAFRMNPYGTIGTFLTGGLVNGNHLFAEESQTFASALLRHTIGRNALSAGSELTALDARYINLPYQNFSLMDLWKEQPRLLSLYAQDVYRWKEAYLNVGVRYDHFTPAASYPTIPGYIIEGALVPAESRSAFSPRLEFFVPSGRLALRVRAGQYAVPQPLQTQFGGLNTDFFRFKNTHLNTVFARPLDLQRTTGIDVSLTYQLGDDVTLGGTFFRNENSDAVVIGRQPFADPTNPGSTVSLNVPLENGTFRREGLELRGSWNASSTTRAYLSATHERSRRELTGVFLAAAAEPLKVTTINGLLEYGRNHWNSSLAVRALAPINWPAGSFAPWTVKTAWLPRLDVHLERSVQIGNFVGAFWVDGLRVLGTSEFVPERGFDLEERAILVSQRRSQLGAGMLTDNVDLSSLQSAGFGVANAVDLHLLRRAEQRFGNGDLQFSAAEQEAAFNAAITLEQHAAVPLNQRRRVQAGIKFVF